METLQYVLIHTVDIEAKLLFIGGRTNLNFAQVHGGVYSWGHSFSEDGNGTDFRTCTTVAGNLDCRGRIDPPYISVSLV
jgi:hypothetical protein